MKNFGKLLLMAAIMMLIALKGQSQTNTAPTKDQDVKQTSATTAPGNFVDKDKNGVCDNFEARSANGQGRNYVDKDGDGICDNRANAGKKSQNNCRNGQGNQNRHGQGRGHGCGNYCRR